MPKHEDQHPIEEMNLEEILAALPLALAAFQKDYRATSYAGQARARKASLNLEKLGKQYRKLTLKGSNKESK
jgi:hypothetical protein